MKRYRGFLIVLMCIVLVGVLAGCAGDFERVGFAGMSFSVPNNWESEKAASDTANGITVKTKAYYPSESDESFDESVGVYCISVDKDKYLPGKHQIKAMREICFSKEYGFTLQEKDRMKVDGKKVRREKFTYKAEEDTATAYVIYIPKGYSLYAICFAYDANENETDIVESDMKTVFASIDFK